MNPLVPFRRVIVKGRLGGSDVAANYRANSQDAGAAAAVDMPF